MSAREWIPIRIDFETYGTGTPESIAEHLRAMAAACAEKGRCDLGHFIADQIEEQTRPQVEEPTGIGAVVAESFGPPINSDVYFIRTNHPTRPWINASFTNTRLAWDDIKAPRVVSEGVQP